jgi:hypothetical protein
LKNDFQYNMVVPNAITLEITCTILQRPSVRSVTSVQGFWSLPELERAQTRQGAQRRCQTRRPGLADGVAAAK